MVANGKVYTYVMEKLNFDPRLNAENITVAIKGNGDIVVLGGTVKSFAEKVIAEGITKNITGVKAVADEIKVEPSTSYKRSDADIAQSVRNALKSSVMIPEERIKVVVEDGNVTLSGEVEWYYQKISAKNAIDNLWGVKSVFNNIVVKPSVTINPKTVQEEIIKEFERHARIDASKVKVTIDGRKVTLKGAVRNLDEMDEAIEAVWSVPGVAEVKNDLTIE